MKTDPSVNNFIAYPDRYVLKVEKQKDNTTQLVAEKKNLWTWIKAQILPEKLVGVYKLEAVYVHLNSSKDTQSNEFKIAVNKVIGRWNDVHDTKLGLLLLSNIEPATNTTASQKNKVSYDQIVNTAEVHFASHQLKEKIIQKIAQKVKDCLKRCDSSPDSRPSIIFGGGYRISPLVSKEEKENEEIEKSVLAFFEEYNFPDVNISVLE